MMRANRHVSGKLRGLYVAIGLVVTITVLGTAGFVLLLNTSIIDGLYMTLITISTLGLKSERIGELGQTGELLIICLIIFGILAAMIALSSMVGFVVEGHVRSILGRRKVDKKIAQSQHHIIVCGFGRMGRAVSQTLRKQHIDVVIIDHAEDHTRRAEEEDLPYILGDATDEAVLRSAGVERARGLITVLPTDADNVFVTLVARGLNPKLLIAARAERLENESRLRQAGANQVICPPVISAQRLANILTRPGVVDFMDFASEGIDLEAEQIRLRAESKLVGQSLRQANLPRELGVLVIALKRRDGQTLFNPSPDTILDVDDVMVVTGQPGSMARLQHYS